jgi:uncharacterized ParB-like nuclease family protein
MRSLVKKAVCRSLDISEAENIIKNPKLKTATAGTSIKGEKISTGAFFPIDVKSKSNTTGMAVPKTMGTGSRYISLRFRLVKGRNFIGFSPR